MSSTNYGWQMLHFGKRLPRGCDPCTNGVEFIHKAHFELTYYCHYHKEINLSKHSDFLMRV